VVRAKDEGEEEKAWGPWGLGGDGSESVKLMFLRKAPALILGPGRCGVGRASDGLTGV
jgi:hypothetical protein